MSSVSRLRGSLFDPSYSPFRRAGEWLLVASALSLLLSVVVGLFAIFYAGGARPRVGAFMSRTDASGTAIVLLGTIWWLTLAVAGEREHNGPAKPGVARRLHQRIGRVFIMYPIIAFLIAIATISLTVPAARLLMFGHTIRYPMKVESVWWAKDRDCHYKARVQMIGIPDPHEICLSPVLFHSHHPGDTLVARFRVLDTLYVIRGMDWQAEDDRDAATPAEFLAWSLGRAILSAEEKAARSRPAN